MGTVDKIKDLIAGRDVAGKQEIINEAYHHYALFDEIDAEKMEKYDEVTKKEITLSFDLIFSGIRQLLIEGSPMRIKGVGQFVPVYAQGKIAIQFFPDSRLIDEATVYDDNEEEKGNGHSAWGRGLFFVVYGSNEEELQKTEIRVSSKIKSGWPERLRIAQEMLDTIPGAIKVGVLARDDQEVLSVRQGGEIAGMGMVMNLLF